MITLNEKAANAVREALEARVYLDKHFVSSLAFCKYKEKAFAVTSHSETILNALQRQADLIRVIELAESALISVNEKSHFVPAIVQDALSEIRKLKGK